MGHALNGSIQDALIRYHRMRGRRAKWILGTDHAGIATQKQVEKRLGARARRREEIGREAFIERVWEWRERVRRPDHRAVQAPRRLAATTTTSASRSTSATCEAVLKVFVDLYEQGLIYRDHYMVNWDPGRGSAISDLEVEEREVDRHALLDRLPARYGDGELVVATVRPETMLADTAVAVHPDDERYRAPRRHDGRSLPLVGRELPIIADEYVKTDFGTGALKITPGHDPNDFEIGRRHGLRGDQRRSARTAA